MQRKENGSAKSRRFGAGGLRRGERGARRLGAVAPAFDSLEPRVVLGLMTWDGGGGDGLWRTAANWSGDRVPGELDHVTIPGGAIVVSDNNARAAGLVVDAGAELTLQQGTLAIGSGGWEQNGNLKLVDGSASVAAPGILRIGAGSLVQKSAGLSNLTGAVENRGRFEWTSGDLRLANAQFRNFARPDPAMPGFLLRTDARLAVHTFGDSAFINEPGALVAWEQSGGSPISIVHSRFENLGTVQVLRGTMKFEGRVTNSGVFNLRHNQPFENGEPLIFRGDSAHANASFTGSGRVRFEGASTHTLGGDIRFLSGPGIGHTGGTGEMRIDGNATLHGPFWLTQGPIVVDGTLTVAADGSLWLTAALGTGPAIEGQGQLVVNGLLDWKGGEMRPGGTTLISPEGKASVGKYNQGGHVGVERVLTNRGFIAWAGGNIRFGAHQARIVNEPGATFNAQSGESMLLAGNYSGVAFVNRGFFNRNGANNATTGIHVNFDNTGTARAANGTLRLSGGGTLAGVLTADDVLGVRMGRLWFEDGLFALQNGVRFVSNGPIDFGGGSGLATARLTGIAAFEGDAATLRSRMTFRVEHGSLGAIVGALAMEGGNLEAAGTLVVGRPTDRHATIQMSGGAVIGSGTLRIDGQFVWKNGEFKGTGLTEVRYQGLLDVQEARWHDHDRRLNNLGRVRATSATLRLIGNVVQVSGGALSGGLWQVESSTLDLPAAVTTIGAAARLVVRGLASSLPDFTALTANQGQLTIDNATVRTGLNFVNTGTIALVGKARLEVQGNFTSQAAPAALQFYASSGVAGAYPQIVASGRATLGGSLLIRRLFDWTPAGVLNLELVRGEAGRSGQFQTVTFAQGLAPPRKQSIVYTGNAATVAYRPS